MFSESSAKDCASEIPTVIDDRPKFDWRPEADNAWTDEMRNEYRELYTDAWVRLQERYNPNWEVKLT